MSPKHLPTSVLLVVVLGLLTVLSLAGVVGVYITVRSTDRAQRSTTEHIVAAQAATDREIVASAYKSSIDRWHQSQYGCGRAVDDRRLTLRAAKATYSATLIVAHDPRQPQRTREARLLEAQAIRRQIRGLRLRVPPQFSCARAYPKPDAPPGVRPLR